MFFNAKANAEALEVFSKAFHRNLFPTEKLDIESEEFIRRLAEGDLVAKRRYDELQEEIMEDYNKPNYE